MPHSTAKHSQPGDWDRQETCADPLRTVGDYGTTPHFSTGVQCGKVDVGFIFAWAINISPISAKCEGQVADYHKMPDIATFK